jgi:hypothetical protein
VIVEIVEHALRGVPRGFDRQQQPHNPAVRHIEAHADSPGTLINRRSPPPRGAEQALGFALGFECFQRRPERSGDLLRQLRQLRHVISDLVL